MGGDRFGEKHTYTYIKNVHQTTIFSRPCPQLELLLYRVRLAFIISCTWRVLPRSQTCLPRSVGCHTGVRYVVYLACTVEVANTFTQGRREKFCFLHCWLFFTLLVVFLHSQESSATQSELVRLRRRSRRCVWHEKGDEAAPGCAENKCIRNGGRRAVFHFHERPRVPTAFDVRDAARFHFDDGRFPVCVGEVGEERAI